MPPMLARTAPTTGPTLVDRSIAACWALSARARWVAGTPRPTNTQRGGDEQRNAEAVHDPCRQQRREGIGERRHQ